MKFIRKPVVIEAVQHFADMGTYTAVIPQWLITACSVRDIFCKDGKTYVKLCDNIWREVLDGDWIVRNPDGEFDVHSDEDFKTLYEPVTQ